MATRSQVVTYDEKKHTLVRQMAHRALLTPEEVPAFEEALRAAGVPLATVTMPDWPPVPYAPLALVFGGDGEWWDGMTWTGVQLVIENRGFKTTSPDGREHWAYSRNTASKIAKDLAGDRWQPKRQSYLWGVEPFDATRHVIVRFYCAEHDLSIVDFWRKYFRPAVERVERDPIIKVTCPRAATDAKAGKSYSPTRRAVAVADRAFLHEFRAGAERLSFNLDQVVTWQRSLDGSRWEARRQVEPQARTWMSHRSFINRQIGQGAWTEIDRDPVEGYAFGPFAELWDDGALYLWVTDAGRKRLEADPIVINGVSITLVPDVGRFIWRMAGQVPPDQMQTLLGTAWARVARAREAQADAATADEPAEPITVETSWKWRGGGKWGHATAALPEQFHRTSGTALVLHPHEAGDCEVRAWGDPTLAGGFTLNDLEIPGPFEPWNNGWRGHITQSQFDAISGRAKPKPKKKGADDSDTLVMPREDITSGARVYSPAAVLRALTSTIGREPRLFGRSASDSAFVALTRTSVDSFLALNRVDNEQYVLDRGNRNFDCENFSEQLRADLQTKYGVNGVGVIWGDGHAFNFFVVAGGDEPEILMVEPQTDAKVDTLEGNYSVEHRCEVLL